MPSSFLRRGGSSREEEGVKSWKKGRAKRLHCQVLVYMHKS